jgi:hypothetical protein
MHNGNSSRPVFHDLEVDAVKTGMVGGDRRRARRAIWHVA